MHRTAMQNARRFFDTYVKDLEGGTVLDIGSSGATSLRRACPPQLKYLGADLAPGEGVDVVIEDPYKYPLPDESVDVVVTSSCFEHSEMFWLLYLEIMRVLRPAGLLYVNAPSNGVYHRYPVDCWRFYPDCGMALVRWGRRSGFNSALLESYTSNQHSRGTWNDFVGVFIKDEEHAGRYPRRIIESFTEFSNGRIGPVKDDALPRNFYHRPQDQRYYGWKLHKRVQKLGWYLRTGFGHFDPERER